MNEKKVFYRTGILYEIIISAVNYMGYLLASTGKFPSKDSVDLHQWIAFLECHEIALTVLSVLSFIIPGTVCFCYVFCCKKKNFLRRLINLPIYFSFFGALGWGLNFLCNICFLVYAKLEINIQIFDIAFTSFLNIFQAGLFIFTLGFLILYTLNTKFVLPKYFPEVDLMKIQGVHKTSVSFLFIIFYFSIGLFPIFFLYSSLTNYAQQYLFLIDENVKLVLLFLISFGLVIALSFSNFFSYPLRKLREGAEKIKQGDYSHRVNVVSNDSFGELTGTFNEMTVSLNQKTKKILAIQDSVIRGMAVMVESRDNSTGGHINRTSDCVKVFIDYLRTLPEYEYLTESFCSSMIKAAPMHDLGKIAVDDAILRKPGKFTDEEYALMKNHSAEGARIVESVLKEVDDQQFKTIAVNVAHYHHEKWDGSGYPAGLKETQIPLEARIMALADVFDALVSRRCYKDSFSYDRAFGIIQESLGNHFDPELGKAFVECRPLLEKLYMKYEN